MSAQELTQSILSLPVSERIDIADQIYASVPDAWQNSVEAEWKAEIEKRIHEMDTDPEASISFEDFKELFRDRRSKA